MKCKCVYLYADWCHCPTFEIQEICPFYFDDEKAQQICSQYKTINDYNLRKV